jgi:transposase
MSRQTTTGLQAPTENDRRGQQTKKVRVVCDNGRFHTTKAVLAFLEANRDKIEIDWLPPYCPDLNLADGIHVRSR